MDDVSQLRSDIVRIRRVRNALSIGAATLIVGGRLLRDELGFPPGGPVVGWTLIAVVAVSVLLVVLRTEQRERAIKETLRDDPRFAAAMALWRNRSDGRSQQARFDAAVATLLAHGIAPDDARPILEILIR